MRMLTLTMQALLAVSVPLALMAQSGEIYRVVDEHGNVTYTDQAPEGGAEPMDLPELSIIEMETPEGTSSEAPAGADEPNLRELRRKYRDFGIRTPADEETFWGTANEVVISWGSEEPLLDGMTVKLFVDESPTDVTGLSSTKLKFERGTHTARVELYRGGRRPVVTSPTVTFFVKQVSVGFDPGPMPPIAR